MPTQKQGIQKTVVALLAVAALVLGVFVYQHMNFNRSIDPTQIHGTLLDKSRPVNAFELTGIDQKKFSNASLQGQWTMMFFGFTNCGSICPTTMAELGKMYHILEEKKAKTLPRIIMISIDPQRDTLEQLNTYVKAFNPNFYGARGEEDSIQAMTRELGIAYARIALKGTDEAETYDIEHTGTVMLFNPKGELSAFFTMPHQASLMAEDFQLLTS